jgi:3-oxoacyl-[acyl-carrier protein] reductase
VHHPEFGARDGDIGIGTVVFALLTKILSTGLRFLHMEDVVKLLSGKVVLVTGSSRGIGAAIARLFADQGAKVALHGRDTAALSAVRSEIEKNGGVAIQATADVTDFAEIEAMRQDVERQLGAIAILVANAGGSFTRPGPIEEITEEGWRASVDGNLTATFLTIKSVLPGMKQRKEGNIITISSSAGRRSHPQAPIAYSAAKAGIQILTQDVAAQAGPFGIRVNCIAPEAILTERNLQRIPEAQQKSLADQHPIRRLGTPEDVAQAALFLASENAPWITGVVLDVAGGAVMT